MKYTVVLGDYKTIFEGSPEDIAKFVRLLDHDDVITDEDESIDAMAVAEELAR